MKTPCQAVVWYLLPSIGAELARELAKRGMPQKEIAMKLGITPAAVSQYIKGVRGAEVKLGGDSLKEIHKLADKLENGSADEAKVILSVCDICRIAWRERVLCEHQKMIGKGSPACARCSDGKARCRQ